MPSNSSRYGVTVWSGQVDRELDQVKNVSEKEEPKRPARDGNRRINREGAGERMVHFGLVG